MNVRVHFVDFTHQDFKDVKEVKEGFRDYMVEIIGQDFEPIQTYNRCGITSIEIRLG
jgi:hypothetical protein